MLRGYWKWPRKSGVGKGVPSLLGKVWRGAEKKSFYAKLALFGAFLHAEFKHAGLCNCHFYGLQKSLHT